MGKDNFEEIYGSTLGRFEMEERNYRKLNGTIGAITNISCPIDDNNFLETMIESWGGLGKETEKHKIRVCPECKMFYVEEDERSLEKQAIDYLKLMEFQKEFLLNQYPNRDKHQEEIIAMAEKALILGRQKRII